MNTSPASESVTLRLPDATLEGVLTLPPGGGRGGVCPW